MSRRLVPLLVTLLVVVMATPAAAITFGTPDDPAHPRYPNVGAVIANDPSLGGEIVWCSGTLVAPTLFLTAAHCLVGIGDTTIVGVSFDAVPVDGTGTIVGTVIPVAPNGLHPNPGYPGPGSNPLDLAIIELSQAPAGVTLATLPTLQQFDAIATHNGLHGQQFTAVGYGSAGRQHEPGGGTPQFVYPDNRQYADSTFLALNQAWLRLSMNPSTGNAGGCYGDSGGPNFLGAQAPDTAVIAGITITGDTVCRATNVIYRLDSASAQSFLATFGLVSAASHEHAKDKHAHRQHGHHH